MMHLKRLFRTRLGHVALVLAAGGCTASEDRSRITDTAGTVVLNASLDSTARRLVAFLRAGAPPLDSALADTVTLYVAPEGGGGSTRLSRDRLRDRARWVVRAGRATYRFPPPPTATRLSTRAGVHFNCHEYPLASRFPDLARLPHVGTKLEPENASSCLQSWNVTFVFDSSAPNRLVGAVYDQWEW